MVVPLRWRDSEKLTWMRGRVDGMAPSWHTDAGLRDLDGWVLLRRATSEWGWRWSQVTQEQEAWQRMGAGGGSEGEL